MRAREIMTTRLVTARPDTPVRELAVQMLEQRISAVPIVDDEDRLLGIVSESDLLRRPETGGERQRAWWLQLLSDAGDTAAEYVRAHGRYARDVMTRSIIAAHEDTAAAEIADLMQRHSVKRVPVVRDGRLVGIVSRVDLLRGLAAQGAGTAGPVDDGALRAAVEQALRKADWSRIETLTVVVHDGIVTVSGLVSAPEQKRALRVLIDNIHGVKALRDETVVRPIAAGY